MRIISLDCKDEALVQQVAVLLVEGFRASHPGAWPDLESALEEVREACEPGRISRVAIDENGAVLGWIGGIRQCDGRVWEVHPLVVSPGHQRRGIGRMLVTDLENLARPGHFYGQASNLAAARGRCV